MTGNEKPTPALRIPTSANLDSWNLAEEGGSVGYLIEANAMIYSFRAVQKVVHLSSMASGPTWAPLWSCRDERRFVPSSSR